jgi:hypothetical protein
MLEQTKNKSLDELEDLIGRFSREYADYNIQDDGSDVGSGEFGAEANVDEHGIGSHPRGQCRQSHSTKSSNKSGKH